MKKIVISNKLKGIFSAFAAGLFATAAFAAHKYRSGEANDSAFAVLVFVGLTIFCGYKSYKEFSKI